MLTLKYNESDFAAEVVAKAQNYNEQIQDSFDFNDNPARKVWLHVPLHDIHPTRWRVQAWEGDPLNADLLEEVPALGVDICRSMEYLCSDISRGIRVIDGGATLVAENIALAVVRQDPEVLTPETCDAILQMLIYGAIPHK